MSGYEDHLRAVDENLLSHAECEYGYHNNLITHEDYKPYADAMVEELELPYPPTNHDDALFLYLLLKDDCDDEL